MTTIITQARVNSTRLPNKIFREAGGKPFLLHHIERLKKTGLQVIVATTNDGSEEPIVNFCEQMGLAYYRGDEQDVLKRFYETAKQFNADTIIRVTSDCPLIDPDIIKSGLNKFNQAGSNTYYSNALERTYPRGMDYEIFSFKLLEEAYHNAVEQPDREHVTPYIWNNRSGNVHLLHDKQQADHSKYRITLDTAEDQELITILIEKYGADKLSSAEIVEIIEANPHLSEINAHIEQKKV